MPLTKKAPVQQIKKSPWSPQEDSQLSSMVRVHGPKRWATIAVSLPGRTGKQCRERWLNHLDPSVSKESFSKEEDSLIVSLVATLGTKWAQISKHMPGRTDNAVKNRYYSTLRRLHCKTTDRPTPSRRRKASKASTSASPNSSPPHDEFEPSPSSSPSQSIQQGTLHPDLVDDRPFPTPWDSGEKGLPEGSRPCTYTTPTPSSMLMGDIDVRMDCIPHGHNTSRRSSVMSMLGHAVSDMTTNDSTSEWDDDHSGFSPHVGFPPHMGLPSMGLPPLRTSPTPRERTLERTLPSLAPALTNANDYNGSPQHEEYALDSKLPHRSVLRQEIQVHVKAEDMEFEEDRMDDNPHESFRIDKLENHRYQYHQQLASRAHERGPSPPWESEDFSHLQPKSLSHSPQPPAKAEYPNPFADVKMEESGDSAAPLPPLSLCEEYKLIFELINKAEEHPSQ